MKNSYKVLLIGLSVLGVVYAGTGPDKLTDEEANKMTVRWAMNALNKGDWESMRNLYSPRFVQHSPASQKPTGWEDYELGCRIAHRKFPGHRYRIEDIIAEGDKVAVRMILSIPIEINKGTRYETKKKFEVTELGIIRIANGVIVEEWVQFDKEAITELMMEMR